MIYFIFNLFEQAEELQNQMEQDYDIGWVYKLSLVHEEIFILFLIGTMDRFLKW